MKLQFTTVFLALIAISCGSPEPENKKKKLKLNSTSSVKKESLLDKARNYFQPIKSIPENDENPITAEKVKLGKALYFDKQLSKDGNISCNSCHNLDTYGVDNLPTSPGDEGKNGDRNSPTVLNAAFHFAQFWDGRAADVEEQAGMPILNPVEMNIPSEAFLVDRLNKSANYKALFAQAFPEDKAISFNNVANAIGAFERTLITPSTFDQFLQGNESVLNAEETKGLELFINKGCITCHTGKAVGGSQFQKFGLFGDYWDMTGSKVIDEGLAKETGNESDKYFFKVPSLRNIDKTAPYFHDGSVNDLKEAVIIMAKLENNKDLTDDEANAIVSFLGTLTGEVPAEAKEI
ncbi:MAG: cytochrome-c peroxidase [Salibacteraceae bacterium]